MTTDKMFSASKIILFFCSMDNTRIVNTKPIRPNDVFNGEILFDYAYPKPDDEYNIMYIAHRIGVRITEKMRLIITSVGDKDYPATFTEQHDAVIALNNIAKDLLNNQNIFTDNSKALLLSLMLSSATRR